MVVSDERRLRIDSILVDKFRRLPGGINEVGVKIVRDIGLRYVYDKTNHTLDLIGPDTSILSLAVETLRFWVENDEFPQSGITCQVGYPNRGIVIWRFHGDYAKKFDHLFEEDIAMLKQIPTVNIKAVPSKKNPEYIELYCHFGAYHQVKKDVIRISAELGKIFHDDFFVPKSDFIKAKKFARSRAKDTRALFALKEYPNDNIRVWIFARLHADVIRARKEWIRHVGMIARDTAFSETPRKDKDADVNTAAFYGHLMSASSRESFRQKAGGHVVQNGEKAKHVYYHPNGIHTFKHHSENSEPTTVRNNVHRHTFQTSQNLSVSKQKAAKPKTSPRNAQRLHEYNNPNFPRPIDFIYPIKAGEIEDESDILGKSDLDSNPFANKPSTIMEQLEAERGRQHKNPALGQWIPETASTNMYRAKISTRYKPENHLYVHHQVPGGPNKRTTQTGNKFIPVAHPEVNLIAKERFNPKRSMNAVLTSVTDAGFAPATKKGTNVRPGVRQTNDSVRLNRPTLLSKKKGPYLRYHIKVNSLDILMYRHNIAKLTNMDALINAVHTNLGPGGASAAAVLEASGNVVQDEIAIYLNVQGPLRVGECMVSSAGRIPALGIVHVAGPVWDDYTDESKCTRDLHSAIYNALKTAESHQYRKVALTAIGSESFFGIPHDLVAEVFVKALVDYSMGMGPMYPVLEIHLVDLDVKVLTYIKDAYESWVASTDFVDMSQHSKPAPEAPIPDVVDFSHRSTSAANLTRLKSHRSQNMVTFRDQSYTPDGNQIWTFEVLEKIRIHVYTGSVAKVTSVEAIVCAVDSNIKGTLAKQIQYAGGAGYELALRAQLKRKPEMKEGNILICEGGDLPMRLVLHAVIGTPMHKVTEANLSRLDSITTKVLKTANDMDISTLAMPLIGTGRLREKFEVEQCSLQLVDSIIELCLSSGRDLRLKELHLVNTNPIMTQCLTQALRTRAHTKLRVEREGREPSRQEMLSQPDAARYTPDIAHTIRDNTMDKEQRELAEKLRLQHEQLEASKHAKIEDPDIFENGSKTPEIETESEMLDRVPSILEGDEPGPRIGDKMIDVSNEIQTVRGKSQQNTNTHKIDTEVFDKNSGNNKDKKENADKNDTAYPSKISNRNNIKLRGDRWAEKVNPNALHLNLDMELEKPRRHNQLKPIGDEIRVQGNKMKSENATKKRQMSKIPVFQNPQPSSYVSILERRRKIKEMGGPKLRRSKSTDEILTKRNADKVLQSFKLERRKREILRRVSDPKPNVKHGGWAKEMESEETREKEKIRRQTQGFFTRNTRDRYKQFQSGERLHDFEMMVKMNNESEMGVGKMKSNPTFSKDQNGMINQNRVIKSLSEGEYERQKIIARNGIQTERPTDVLERTSGESGIRPVQYILKTKKRERFTLDRDREDRYMMDMDFRNKIQDNGEQFDSDTDPDAVRNNNETFGNDPKSKTVDLETPREIDTNRKENIQPSKDTLNRSDSKSFKQDDTDLHIALDNAVPNTGRLDSRTDSVSLSRTDSVRSKESELQRVNRDLKMRLRDQNATNKTNFSKTVSGQQDAVSHVKTFTDSSHQETYIPRTESRPVFRRPLKRDSNGTSTKATSGERGGRGVEKDNIKQGQKTEDTRERSKLRNSASDVESDYETRITPLTSSRTTSWNRQRQYPLDISLDEHDGENNTTNGDEGGRMPLSPNSQRKHSKAETSRTINANMAVGNGDSRVTEPVVETGIEQAPVTEHDVTIRDKLQVHIGVVNPEELDSPKIKKEKAKIKRFWEAVGNEDQTVNEPNKKMLVTQVTKERKMSAKSKSSRKSNASSTVTQKVGKYNVNVEFDKTTITVDASV